MPIKEKKVEFSYIPRKCSFSNQILTSKDHSSIQISIQALNLNGISLRKNKTYAINGKIRRKGISDLALNLLTEETDFLQKIST
ncbi:rps21 (nucleomorph) [Hemiselmis andersenii]|uniref:Rps21 n=1 Tax=Hemiselmis andersenii TaxID=464988 RepID=A9BL43_HEMAN|nr:rps21 [Hemiselmis andersenii]ABW98226.1 rps21 [Hemiselmis andersenii]|mmetsp:Transcript_21721/g.50397  ORF Transcript_21721/g.50397 Transcript_21721/m.50397 type:complete len:84 (-) Transcript_21721:204-455(-)